MFNVESPLGNFITGAILTWSLNYWEGAPKGSFQVDQMSVKTLGSVIQYNMFE